MKTLLVDDDPVECRLWRKLLEGEGLELEEADTGADALTRYQRAGHPLVITDWRLGTGMSGVELAGKVRAHAAECHQFVFVILVTGAHPDRMETALSQGADEFVKKPDVARELPVRVRVARRLIEQVAVVAAERRRREALNRELDRHTHVDDVVDEDGNFVIPSQSSKFQKVIDAVKQVATTDTSVLLLGETGTGKEVLARVIHRRSHRAEAPFIAVNCATLPERLVESTLFGHEKGAFTDAMCQHKGKFEQAHLGTLFLDEMGELPLAMQVKLLRALQEKSFERVGGTEEVWVNLRLVSATNKNLEELVKEGKFREDLYYRINVFPIRLPSLRERPEDIPLLAEHFVKKLRGPSRSISPEVMDQLRQHPWRGNIRELHNVIEGALVYAGEEEVVRLEHLSEHQGTPKAMPQLPAVRADRRPCDLRQVLNDIPETLGRFLDEDGIRLEEATQAFEDAFVRAVYQSSELRVEAKAKLLGMEKAKFEHKRKEIRTSALQEGEAPTP